MHRPKSIFQIETNKILWDSQIETDHIIPARRPDLMDFVIPFDNGGKNKRKRKDVHIL